MSTASDAVPPSSTPPGWVHCGESADPYGDPVGCRGARVTGFARCLAHVDDEQRTAYLATLTPGSKIDLQGTAFTRALLAQLLDALRDTGTDRVTVGRALFSEAQFSGDAECDEVRFNEIARFDGAYFGGAARFDRVRFSGPARFDRVGFDGDARFGGAQFSEDDRFSEVRFGGDTEFGGAQFGGDAGFDGERFDREDRFEGPRYGGGAGYK